MRRLWNEAKITKAIKQLGKTPVDSVSYDRVWFKIEERLEKRQRPFLSFVWKPWSHPIRWVGAAACLCFVLTGFLYYQQNNELNDMAAFMDTVSNPSENVTRDPGVVSLSKLVTESPSASAREAFYSDAPQGGNLSSDDLLL